MNDILTTIIWPETPSDFVSCEKLFPQWITARIILKEFIDKFGGLDVAFDRHNIEVYPKFGFPIEMMPPEDRPKLEAIIFKACKQYLPDLTEFIGQPLTEISRWQIINTLRQHEAILIQQGQRSLKGQFKFALGLTPFEYD